MNNGPQNTPLSPRSQIENAKRKELFDAIKASKVLAEPDFRNIDHLATMAIAHGYYKAFDYVLEFYLERGFFEQAERIIHSFLGNSPERDLKMQQAYFAKATEQENQQIKKHYLVRSLSYALNYWQSESYTRAIVNLYITDGKERGMDLDVIPEPWLQAIKRARNLDAAMLLLDEIMMKKQMFEKLRGLQDQLQALSLDKPHEIQHRPSRLWFETITTPETRETETHKNQVSIENRF